MVVPFFSMLVVRTNTLIAPNKNQNFQNFLTLPYMTTEAKKSSLKHHKFHLIRGGSSKALPGTKQKANGMSA
jgi:hypothetical protein